MISRCSRGLLALLCLCSSATFLQAQTATRKYPSLLWEITGNGMKKPSYLFGTMHISNKLVFHLSDSFYIGIRNVDVVALELNPELWQVDIPRMSQQSSAYERFSTSYSDDFIRLNSFANTGFEGNIKRLIAREPSLNNALLYRTERSSEDFEENTYLDLYIYQTGRKLGKRATGVENYAESQRLMIEAYMDAANDTRSRNRRVSSDVNPYDMMQGMQDAYRTGNLDMLDSLTQLSGESEAYTEKFLYRRNEIQAASMDSIMQHQPLFVGVGAAHLPGKRGVIEILRKKGYRLRPVYMQDRDALQRDQIDSIRVPVRFQQQHSEDSVYSVKAPGPLLPLEGSETQRNYADMANGSYYLVSRLRTHHIENGYSPTRVLHMIDSLLYEAIPGKIVSKKAITRNGYTGYDITNRTRRGDVQRYNIFVTPQEIIVFKMGGTDNYVNGPEAETFFSSIVLREAAASGDFLYEQPTGGFTVNFPAAPSRFYTQSHDDGQPRLELQATDPATGDTYLLMRKDMYTFNFLEQDTFEAGLVAESFLSSDYFDKKSEQKTVTYKGYVANDVVATTKDKQFVRARAIIQGPHQYLLAVRSNDKNRDFSAFFNSLDFTTTRIGEAIELKDTFLKISVRTPVTIKLDPDIASLLAYTRRSMGRLGRGGSQYDLAPQHRYANFMHEPTGEFVIVDVSTFPKYYYAKDMKMFWRNVLNDATSDSDMFIKDRLMVKMDDGTSGYLLTLGDTGSSRIIKKLMLLKGRTFYTISTVLDSRRPESEFTKTFFSTVRPYEADASPTVFESKVNAFFADYNSRDSATRKLARMALPSVVYGREGLPQIRNAMASLQPKDPQYYELKEAWISEIGYIRDSNDHIESTAMLEAIYRNAGDTTRFQNAALSALSRLQTKRSTQLYRDFLLQDPPVFESQYDYASLFNRYDDTLKLAQELYPGLLQLASIPDYKPAVISLLAKLVDGGYVKPETYRSNLATMLFDARILQKKQQAEDEQSLQAEHKRSDDDEDGDDYPAYMREYSSRSDTTLGLIYDYAVLLAPYYNDNPSIRTWFAKLLDSRQDELRARSALLLLRNRQEVPATVWTGLAAKREYRYRLYTLLRRDGRASLLPSSYTTQEDLVRSAVRSELGTGFDTMKLVGKRLVTLRGNTGFVYFYKYRLKNSSDWKLAANGLQPADGKGFNAEPVVTVEDESIARNEPVEKQIDKLIRHLIVQEHPAGRRFYDEEGSMSYNRMMRTYGDGEE